MPKELSVSLKDPQSSTLGKTSHLRSRMERSRQTCRGSRSSASLLMRTTRLSFRPVGNFTTGSCSASTLHPTPTITQAVMPPPPPLPQALLPQLLPRQPQPLVPVLPLIPVILMMIHGTVSLFLPIPSWPNRTLETSTVASSQAISSTTM